jgi:hypothetical protein
VLSYDPYFDEDTELQRQILECMRELGYEVEIEEEQEVTVH